MDQKFLKARIEATKTTIVAYEDAVTALVAGGVQSYTIDTGQTSQTVTALNLPSLQSRIDGLYNRWATLEARLRGASTYGRAGF